MDTFINQFITVGKHALNGLALVTLAVLLGQVTACAAYLLGNARLIQRTPVQFVVGYGKRIQVAADAPEFGTVLFPAGLAAYGAQCADVTA